MTCSISGCSNINFNGLSECALHCYKDNYADDIRNRLLTEFYALMNKYLIDCALERPVSDIDNEIYRNEIVKCRKHNIPITTSVLLRKKFSKRTIFIQGIHFPKEEFTYLELLELFGGIAFTECSLYSETFNLNQTKVLFSKCTFEDSFKIDNPELLLENSGFVFNNCAFNRGVYLNFKEKNLEDQVIKYGLFRDCSFVGVIFLSHATFEKELFNFNSESTLKENDSQTQLSTIILDNLIFKDKCEFNSLDIVNLIIKDTNFLSKLEIKDSIIRFFRFDNSNVKEVFDSYQSRFESCCFHKSIFEDFIGFEKTEFGLKNNYDKKYIARFIYTTFKNFSNFRETKFHSGLDFERVNLKENPNFLKATVSQENTNRETFRIIKHSFDSIGNQIEANRFFIMEMKKYKSDLKDAVSKSGDIETKSELLVLNLNEFFSYFGASYVRPTIILIVVTIPYAIMRYIHEWFYYDNIKSYPKFIEITGLFFNGFAKGFQPVSKFLVSGMEFFSLLYYIAFSLLLWQIIVSVKRKVKR